MTTQVRGQALGTPDPSLTGAASTQQIHPERNAASPNSGDKSRRLKWAVQLVRRGRARGEVPDYGSPIWLWLADTDPRKVAAVVIAAEHWACANDPELIGQRLEDELAARRWAEQKLDAEEWDQATARIRRISTDRRTTPWEMRSRRAANSEGAVDGGVLGDAS